MSEICLILAEVYTEEGVAIWLNSRNRALGNQRPIDLIAAGQGEKVALLAQSLVDGNS